MKLRSKQYSLQKLGTKAHPQFYIALPASWVRARGLSKGNRLTLCYNDDTEEVVVLAPGARPISEVAFVRERVRRDEE